MSLRARQNGGGKIRQGGGRGNGNGSPGGRGNSAGGGPTSPVTFDPNNKGTNTTLSNGNLTASITNDTSLALATYARSTGKYYFEIIPTNFGPNSLGSRWGITLASANPNGGAPVEISQAGTGNGFTGTTGSAYALNDVVGIAVDMTNSTITFYKNNVANGNCTFAANASGLIGASILPYVQQNWGGGTYTWNAKFDASSLTYSPPTGYAAWGMA